MLSYKLIGSVKYATALSLQQLIANRLIQQQLLQRKTQEDKDLPNPPHNPDNDAPLLMPNVILVAEHPPTFTTGRRMKEQVSQEDQSKLKSLGADFHETLRGGLTTFHGPGQLVAYPLIDLKTLNHASINWYVHSLEEALIKTGRHFGLEGTRSEHTGVWIKDAKIAAIGIQASRWVTSHGIALNCNTDLDWFTHIVPCGIVGKGVTSLSKELKRKVTMDETIPVFLDSFRKVFEVQQLTNLDDSHPAISQSIDTYLKSNVWTLPPIGHQGAQSTTQ